MKLQQPHQQTSAPPVPIRPPEPPRERVTDPVLPTPDRQPRTTGGNDATDLRPARSEVQTHTEIYILPTPPVEGWTETAPPSEAEVFRGPYVEDRPTQPTVVVLPPSPPFPSAITLPPPPLPLETGNGTDGTGRRKPERVTVSDHPETESGKRKTAPSETEEKASARKKKLPPSEEKASGGAKAEGGKRKRLKTFNGRLGRQHTEEEISDILDCYLLYGELPTYVTDRTHRLYKRHPRLEERRKLLEQAGLLPTR